MHRIRTTTAATPQVTVMPQPTAARSSASIISAAVLGIAAAWVAAGSSGLLSHALRHAITWVLLLTITVLAWPAGAGRWRVKLLIIAAAFGATLLTAPTIAALNALAVTLVLGALAAAHDWGNSPAGTALLASAQATAIFALYQFAQASIATFWQITNAAAGAIGELGGAIAGQPLNVGVSLAGLDFLVLTVTIVGILLLTRQLSVKACLAAVFVMALGHLAYLGLLANSERIQVAANKMRTERLFANATPAERETLVEAIKFEPRPDPNPIPGLSQADIASRLADERKKLDRELSSLGLKRTDLSNVLASLRDEAVFPEWLEPAARARLLDRLKSSLDALEQQRLFGPATRLPNTLDGFLRAAVPWNLPAVALLFHAVLLVVVFWLVFRSYNAQQRQGDMETRSHGDTAPGTKSPPLPLSLSPPLAAPWLAALAAVAILLPVAAVYSRGVQSFRGKKVVAYEKGFLNWLRPEYGNMLDNMNYGRLSVGMYGMVEPFMQSLGMKFSRSRDLSANDLKDADVLVLFYPNRRWRRSQVERIYKFVERGGSLLVAGEHTIHEQPKGPGSIRYPGEEDEPALEPGDEWVGDEIGNRVNDLIERFGMQIDFDSAEFAVGGWLQSYATVSHPTTTGLRDERNTFGAVVGATVEAPWPARPMIIGRYGFGDIGDVGKSETGSFMGDTRYNAGERLGDIVLAAETQFGSGRVILFGDTSGFTNNLTVSGHPYTARLYAYLASAAAAENPQTPWRQGASGLLAIAGSLLLLWWRRPMAVIVLAAVLGLSLWICTVLTLRANEVIPRGVEYVPPVDATVPTSDGREPAVPEYRGPNNLVYIDTAHHSLASDESLRPDGIMGLTYMLMRHKYLALALPELTGERLMDDPDRRDPSLGVDSLKARLIVSVAPQREYSEREIDVLEEYVARGGRFILMAGADNAEPVRPLLKRFQLNVGLYESTVAYGVAGTAPGTAASFEPFLDQQPREVTPLGHFKVTYTTVKVTPSDTIPRATSAPYTYSPFVRFHAGWPISCRDPTALVVGQYGGQVPLIIVKRHGPPLPQDDAAGRLYRRTAGLVVLVGDSGFAMNKNLEREDGAPIERMRENAFFWRWLLDLLEHEVETWIPPPIQAASAAGEPASDMLPLLEVPLLKVDPNRIKSQTDEAKPADDEAKAADDLAKPAGDEGKPASDAAKPPATDEGRNLDKPAPKETPEPKGTDQPKGPVLGNPDGARGDKAGEPAAQPSAKEDP